ncbi:CDP-glycerol:polyglycerol phosphate glycero-phosphotransferase [Streptomyces hygroscopicus subsp. jinggangensis TL01]|nr:CDP-glycerol:polyglycerol phosphate glycero-phosphotransferase [Streptomyces hygroscopicus subsp. jinggangensis TL01]
MPLCVRPVDDHAQLGHRDGLLRLVVSRRTLHNILSLSG